MYQKQIINLITRKELNIMENIFNQDFFYTATEDVDVTDENFDDVATESAVQLIGSIIYAATSIISSARTASRDAKIDRGMQGTFLSVDKLISSGLPKEQAVAEYKKTLKFLISKNFVNENITLKSNTIDFRDLTEDGADFIMGYYDKIGKIDTYTIKKAAEANKSKLVNLVKAGNILGAILELIGYVVGAHMVGGVIGIVGVVLGVISGTAGILNAAGLNYRARFYNTHQPNDDAAEDKETKKGVKEKDAKESVSIFDPDYFEI
jgi:hypothetical protein